MSSLRDGFELVDLHARYPDAREARKNAAALGMGAVAAFVATVALVAVSCVGGHYLRACSAAVFGGATTTIFAASTAYHSCLVGSWRAAFQRFDHVAIFLGIGCAWTPVLLALHGDQGLALVGATWALALLGVVMKAIRTSDDAFSGALYIAAASYAWFADLPSWLGVMSPAALALLVAGTVTYGGGLAVASYASQGSPALWRLAVLVGAVVHFATIAAAILPRLD